MFANQALTAQTWYRGIKPDAADDVVNQLVIKIGDSTTSLEDELSLAVRSIALTWDAQ